ncbi:MAG: DNA-directed RNA polymerase subunit delta [Bacilli bacterium]|nr:DNA-directed RNA polymerase subunit delta [Bacilli bacterium]
MENYKNESMVDVAYGVLVDAGTTVKFKDLYNSVCEKLELSEEEKDEKISLFYTNLSLDGRFVTLGENEWDLRSRQKYEKVHIDMNDVYSDIDNETTGNMDLEEYSDEERESEGIEVDDEDSDDSIDYDKSREDL